MIKQKNSLDVAKFLCAILVLIVHADPFGTYSKVLSFGLRNVAGVILLPFFFATSGYLLTQKLGGLGSWKEQSGYMKKYLKRLAFIYLVWSAVYFPFVVVKWLRADVDMILLVAEYIRDFFFEGSYSTIWFLPALLSATALYYLLRKWLSSRKIFFLSCGIYVFTLLLSSYYGITSRTPGLMQIAELYYKFFHSVKNGVMFGLLFVSLGGVIAEEPVFSKLTRKHCLFGMIGSIGLLCVEVLGYMLIGGNRGVDTVLSIIPWAVFSLTFALSFDLKPSGLYITLRKLSMLIFLCQRIPISIVDLFLEDTILAQNTMVNFVVISAATFGISFLILYLSKKVKWLNKIY